MLDFNKFHKNIKGLSESVNSIMNEALTPEVLEKMTPEQLELINSSKNALNLDGKSLKEKVNELNKIINNNAAFNNK